LIKHARLGLAILILVILGYWALIPRSAPLQTVPTLDTVPSITTPPLPTDTIRPSHPVSDSIPPTVAAGGDTGVALHPSPPSPVSLDAVDRLVRTLDTASIAFAAPDTLPLLRTGIVQLILSPTVDTSTLRAQLQAPGITGTAVLLAGNRMQATLTGSAFRIVPVRPEIQAVSTAVPTEWLWDVTPTERGSHTLHLTLSVILPVEGRDAYFTLRTFDRSLIVRVSVGQRLLTFLSTEWKWLWTTLLVPLGAWLWRRRKRPSGATDGAA